MLKRVSQGVDRLSFSIFGQYLSNTTTLFFFLLIVVPIGYVSLEAVIYYTLIIIFRHLDDIGAEDIFQLSHNISIVLIYTTIAFILFKLAIDISKVLFCKKYFKLDILKMKESLPTFAKPDLSLGHFIIFIMIAFPFLFFVGSIVVAILSS
jgi:hypothetical protein